ALLARAATIALGLLVAHSVVDYPLRTGAMAAVFAFACGLLVTPPRAARHPAAASSPALARSRRTADVPWTADPGTLPAYGPSVAGDEAGAGARSPVGERWGPGVEWPRAWQSESGDNGDGTGGAEGGGD